MKNAGVLLSGGLDSTTCLAYALSKGYACYAISFDYGQKHHAELNASKKIAAQYNAVQHEVISLPIGHLGGSALTDSTINIPQHSSTKSIPSTRPDV